MSVRAVDWAIRAQTISDSAWRVLMILAYEADEDGYLRATQRSVGQMADMSDSVVKRHMDVLIARGMVRRTAIRRMGGGAQAFQFELQMGEHGHG